MSEAEAIDAGRPWYRRRWLKVLTVALVLVVGAFYYLFIDRYEVRKAADGWEFTGSFVGLRCTHCTGIVRLAYKGRVLAPPLHGFQKRKEDFTHDGDARGDAREYIRGFGVALLWRPERRLQNGVRPGDH